MKSKAFRFLGTVLLVALMASCRADKSHPLRLTILDWSQSYTQGVHSVRCALVNASLTNVTLRDWATVYPTLNAATCLGKDTRHFTILQDSVPYNPNATTNLVLRSGERIEVVAESVFDVPPGNYQMFVILQNDPSVRSKPKNIHLERGAVTKPSL